MERLGGKPLNAKSARDRETYLNGLDEAERSAYAEAHRIWSREEGNPAAAHLYLDGLDLVKAKLKAAGTTRTTIPHDIPGEEPARLTAAARARRQEMREAIDRVLAQILPKAAIVRLVENIRIAYGRAEARALAYRLRKGEIRDVDFTTKNGKDYFAHFSARDNEGNLFVQVFPPDAVPPKPAKGGKPEQPGTPSAAHIYLDYMGPADSAIHGFSGPRYEVGLIHTERGHRRLGIASALYDTIEKALGVKLVPSGLLLPDGYKFWQSRNPELLRGYAQEGDSWISPRQIRLGLDNERKNLTEAIADGKLDKIEKYKASVAQYEAWWKAVPQDLKAQNKLDAMFSLRGEAGLEALGRTDPYTMIISLAARAIEAEARARGVSAGEQAEKVLRHEGLEFFKALGLINGREWSVLESAARREGWVDETGVREPYSELYHEGVMSRAELERVLIKEAIAEKYSEFHLGRREFPGMIGQVFTRIKDFLTRAMNAVRGMGFQKWEDVFDRIDRGEFKQRFEEAFGGLRSPNERIDQPDQMLALAGRRAQTADRGMLALAERMEERGKKPKDIWRATGWLRGPDAMWRFEIDDSQAKITNLDKLATPPTRDFLTSLLGREPKATTNVKTVKNIPLPQLLQHPQLYTAYPFLRQMRVDLAYGPRLKAGGALRLRQTSGQSTYLPIRVIAASAKDVKTILVHEVQHYIQNREGFAAGSDTPGRQRRDILFATGEEDVVRGGRPPVYDPAQRDLPDSRQWRMGKSLIDDTKLENIAERLLNQYDLEREGNAEAKGRITNLEAELEREMRVKSSTYARSYGEWEARLAEERQNLTAEERRVQFPLEGMPEGLDISREQTRDYQQAYDEIMRRAQINRSIRARWAERQEIGNSVSVVRGDEDHAGYFFGDEAPKSTDPFAQVPFHPENMMARADFFPETGSGTITALQPFYDLSYAQQKKIMDVVYRDVQRRNMQPGTDSRWKENEQFEFWRRYDPSQVYSDPRLYRGRLEAAVKAQYGDKAKLVLFGDIDPKTGERYEGAYEPFGVYVQKNSGEKSMLETARQLYHELEVESNRLDEEGHYEDDYSFQLHERYVVVGNIIDRMVTDKNGFGEAADAEYESARKRHDAAESATEKSHTLDRFNAVAAAIRELELRGETIGSGLENISLIADEHGVIKPQIRSQWDADRGTVEPSIYETAQIHEVLRERGIQGDRLLSVRRGPSPLDQTFADIRAELGLEMPKTAWKGNKTPSARQQLIAIATAGGEQVLRLHGETMAPWLAANRAGLERMALPLSTDPIGDGFNLFWREFVLRPDNLRQTHGQLYNDFADILDAETPHLLESIDKMHTIGREQLAERRAAAAAGGAGGRVPPAGPPPLPASGGDRWPKMFRRFADSYKHTFQPELVSNAAFEADPLFAAYRAGSAQEKDMIIARGEELYQLWRKQPEAARLQFLKDVDAGAAQPTPQLAEIAYRYRQLLDRAYRDEVAYGSKAAYVEDYMPRLFEKEKDVEQFLASRTAALGPTWFQKHRHYDLLEEALAAGHKLKTTNPEELVALRLMAGADMRQRMELLMGLERMGLARRVRDLQQAGDLRPDAGDGVPVLNENDGFARAGWKTINAPNREQWLLSPDIQPLWQNAVEAQGFWQHPGAAGSVFRGWMMFKNAWVPIKLTLSAFHPLHVLHINIANDLARGFSQARGGDLRGALESFVDAFTPTQGVGYEARHAWAKRPQERTPQEQGMVDMMVEGGFSPQLSEQLRVAARRNLQEAMDKGWKKSGQIALHGLRFAIEKMQSRIFEHWIPGLKAAAYIKEAQALFERRPDLLDDATKRRVALRAIAKSVDNRFGEMFYSTLFWDRYWKDAGIGSFLSLGWNLGFVREFGGAAVELVSRQFTPSLRAKETVREVTNKRAFALLYISTAMLINGVMSWGLSGEAPDEFMDFIFPRIGGKNPDGSKRRITNMFYTRELPMLTKHMQEQGGGVLGGIKGAKDMLWNKMMFQPFFEIWENRSYWGYEIYDPDSPFYQQAAQLVGYAIGDQLSPITFGGAQRARDLSGSWWDKSVPMSFLGFGPAPAYAERSALENRIRHYYTEFVAPLKKPYAAEELADERRRAIEELKLARLKGDVEGAAKAKEKAIAAGAKSKYLTKSKLEVPTTFYLFSKLPEETQRHLLQEMSPSDRNNYRKFAKQKLRREFPAIVGSGGGRSTTVQPESAEAH